MSGGFNYNIRQCALYAVINSCLLLPWLIVSMLKLIIIWVPVVIFFALLGVYLYVQVQWNQSSPGNLASHYSDQSMIKWDSLAASVVLDFPRKCPKYFFRLRACLHT